MEWIAYLQENYPQLLGAGALGGALTWLVTTALNHWLAKSRSKEAFERQEEAKHSEADAVILSLLGVLANDIMNCWEEGTVIEAFSKGGPRDQPIRMESRIALKDYSEVKTKLVAMNVFPAKVWHNLDRLPIQVNEINNKIRSLSAEQVHIHAHHFANFAKTLWGIVVQEYIRRGGDMSNLTTPMPLRTGNHVTEG